MKVDNNIEIRYGTINKKVNFPKTSILKHLVCDHYLFSNFKSCDILISKQKLKFKLD